MRTVRSIPVVVMLPLSKQLIREDALAVINRYLHKIRETIG